MTCSLVSPHQYRSAITASRIEVTKNTPKTRNEPNKMSCKSYAQHTATIITDSPKYTKYHCE